VVTILAFGNEKREMKMKTKTKTMKLKKEEEEAEELLKVFGRVMKIRSWAREMLCFRDPWRRKDKTMRRAWLAVRKKAIKQDEDRRAVETFFIQAAKRKGKKQ
jgi:hypothetical protein